jgi:hypothetical protein
MTSPHAASQDDSLSTALWLLVAQAGHYGCAGWTYEQRDRLLRCACGTPLYELWTIESEDQLDASSHTDKGKRAWFRDQTTPKSP